MKQKTFTCIYYTDPGHGWFKVKRSVLHNLGIADKITPYSYQRGEYVYLEEDCDAFELHQALKQNGTTLRVVEKHTDRDSRIRSYERYKPFTVVDIQTLAVSDSQRRANTGIDSCDATQVASPVAVWQSHE